MQSLNVYEVINRLSDLQRHCIATPAINETSQEWKDCKKIADICHRVRGGLSANSRLATADKLLTKWGF